MHSSPGHRRHGTAAPAVHAAAVPHGGGALRLALFLLLARMFPRGSFGLPRLLDWTPPHLDGLDKALSDGIKRGQRSYIVQGRLELRTGGGRRL